MLYTQTIHLMRHATYKQVFEQEFQEPQLNSYLGKFYGRYNDIVSKYNFPLGRMLIYVFHTKC